MKIAGYCRAGGRRRQKQRGSVLVESLFGIVLLLALIGGTVWLNSLADGRIRVLVADRFVAWNRGLENRGYREGIGEQQEAEYVTEHVFGDDARTGRGTVNRVYYNWCLFGGGEQRGTAPPPAHWADDDWALYHGIENTLDAWIGQNHAAVSATIGTPASTVAFLQDSMNNVFGSDEEDLPATMILNGRVGGVEMAGGQGVQVASCVTMRTGVQRRTIAHEEQYGNNAQAVATLLGNFFVEEE